MPRPFLARPFFLLCALLLFSPCLHAQLSQSSSHQQAARELFMLVGGSSLAQSAAESMVAAMAKGNPGIEKYRPAISKWCNRVFTSQELVQEMSALYAKHFTEEELKGLIVFYKTPLGQKNIRVLPIIMKEGMELGAKHGEKHNPELMQMLAEVDKGEAGN